MNMTNVKPTTLTGCARDYTSIVDQIQGLHMRMVLLQKAIKNLFLPDVDIDVDIDVYIDIDVDVDSTYTASNDIRTSN